MILNDIRMPDTQLPETDHTPYCPGRDINRGFIIEQSKDLQVGSRARARGKGRKGSRDHADGSRARARGKGRKGSRDHADGARARGKGRKGSRDHADGARARGKGRKSNGPEDRARGGAHAHTRACARARAHTRACARARARLRLRLRPRRQTVRSAASSTPSKATGSLICRSLVAMLMQVGYARA
jgi:hypothetical protein